MEAIADPKPGWFLMIFAGIESFFGIRSQPFLSLCVTTPSLVSDSRIVTTFSDAVVDATLGSAAGNADVTAFLTTPPHTFVHTKADQSASTTPKRSFVRQ